MKNIRRVWKPGRLLCCIMTIAFCAVLGACSGGSKQPGSSAAKPEESSKISVEVKPNGPIIFRSPSAQFEVQPDGYVKASLLRDGKELSLDQLGPQSVADQMIVDGKEVHFRPDFSHAKILPSQGKMGRGKRVEVPAEADGNLKNSLHATLAYEIYDDFPNLAVTTEDVRNEGKAAVKLERIVAQAHTLDASLSDSKIAPYDMWSFQGSSYEWGKDDVLKMKTHFSQPNLMGVQLKNGTGGGIPVVAFWTANVGEAIGHLETLPLVLSLPVKVQGDGRVAASMTIEPNASLQAGDTYSMPRSFVAVYHGDFYEPLHLYSTALQREGWTLPKPSNEAYNISWCGWGYEFNVTAAKMLGTIPKLKEFNIKWATLDDRWFDAYGDWNPRSDTFPGNSIQDMVKKFHEQGIYAQIWWLPLGVEDGQGRWESHKYAVSQVVKEHPDWLILDKQGKHARMIRDLAALCPAVPEVKAYYKQLTEKFIHDWDFDGHKLDNIYTVPACYNPKHHHKSPQDSINAMADIYREIFQATRALKPQSVTQSCPCGTPPSLAWLPYMDQAVTADPVGSVQVRRRIKMYKALLGPDSAVYGDHVELTKIRMKPGPEQDLGRDFASTIGTGGVVGTKFVWPNPGPHFQQVALTSEKEVDWKKWIDIYNQKMLSKGEFLDLYTYGYDVPEGYAISKDGDMYYAFFAPEETKAWKGDVELRGLAPGQYQVSDYETGKDLGGVTAAEGKTPKLAAEFKEHLLLEVKPAGE